MAPTGMSELFETKMKSIAAGKITSCQQQILDNRPKRKCTWDSVHLSLLGATREPYYHFVTSIGTVALCIKLN